MKKRRNILKPKVQTMLGFLKDEHSYVSGNARAALRHDTLR